MPTVSELLAEAEAFRHASRLADAERACRLALEADCDSAQAHNLLGKVLGVAGNLEQAEACFRRAIACQEDFSQAHSNLGVTMHMRGEFAEAVAAFRTALEHAPHDAELYRKLGGTLEELGARDEALACCRRAVELQPAHADAHNSLGVLLERHNRLDEAVASLREAVRLKPDFAQAFSNLGAALEEQGKLDEAAAALDRAIALDPNRVEPYTNLALVWERQGRLDEALAACARAVSIDPNCAAAHVNLGLVLERQGKLAPAEASFRRALEADSGCPEAHLNYALLLLRDGDFRAGFREYEWRFRCEGASEHPRPQPRWNGEPLAGRTILLCEEQGFGDSLQFVRFAELVKQRDATVIVQCRPELADLVKTGPGVDAVVVTGSPLPRFDVHLPLASLPGVLGTTVTTIPNKVPYLVADATLVAKWKHELAPVKAFKVGIAWQGNPDNKADRYRSIPWQRFVRLAAVPGVQLFSLQMGAGRQQLVSAPAPATLTDLSARIGDFRDTAAIMGNLDLVISCDSSPAHLAGALGLPVWVALAFVADWRYLHAREDSPWYPTMRLYRQRELGDWEGLLERIATDLEAAARERG